MASAAQVKQGVDGAGQAGQRWQQGHGRRRAPARRRKKMILSTFFLVFIRILIGLTCGALVHLSKRFSFSPHQSLQVGPIGQISYQFVINLSLVRIAKNLPYTCEILRLK
jgi:hypothetical protein